MLTIGVLARRALCTLASPLASPGPRCRRVEAGLSAMRAYPSAAPVATPSNSPSTHRTPPTRSSAATKCISEVPGLAKQTSTPAPDNVLTRLSAPFICSAFPYAPTGSVQQGLEGYVSLATLHSGASLHGQGGRRIPYIAYFWCCLELLAGSELRRIP